jgi:predicted NBD/HSP70 family sugar kinase
LIGTNDHSADPALVEERFAGRSAVQFCILGKNSKRMSGAAVFHMPVSPRGSSMISTKPSDRSARLNPRGSNQIGMRQFNERVVLQAIRLNGSPSQAEIARLTHLTAQTVSLILERLENDKLLLRLSPLRGKVGQPSVPISLNPDGAFAIGIKIGRRNMDALLVDFVGHVRKRLSLNYTFPDPDRLFDDINDLLKSLRSSLKPVERGRLCGIGIAAPLSLGGWQQLLGVAPVLAEKWQSIDLRERVMALSASNHLPVEFAKDTAAACVAELVGGRGRAIRSFLYVFVDTFIGGGLVLDGHLYGGTNGNAGAFGSIPLHVSKDESVLPGQLLSVASLWNLEALYARKGLEIGAWADERALKRPWASCSRAWLQRSSRAIAMAINSAACLLDIESVIIDGSFSRQLLEALLSHVDGALNHYSWEGVARPAVLGGTIGSDARALGGAMLPIYANFAPDQDLFLKIAP